MIICLAILGQHTFITKALAKTALGFIIAVGVHVYCPEKWHSEMYDAVWRVNFSNVAVRT